VDDCHVAFDFLTADHGLPSEVLAILGGLALAFLFLLGGVFVGTRKIKPKALGWLLRCSSTLPLAFVFSCLAYAYSFLHDRTERLESVYRQHRYVVTSGAIDSFTPASDETSGWEALTVDGVTFRYADFDDNGGFHQTVQEGGPVRSGMSAVVWHSYGTILHLELCDASSRRTGGP